MPILKRTERETNKAYNASHPGYFKSHAEVFREVNPDYHKNYNKTNSTKKLEYGREYENKRYDTDPLYKLRKLLRSRLRIALKSKSWHKGTHFVEYIGCTLDILKAHIEKQFTEGMSWNNHGAWHIDHIIPLASAKTSEELYKLCHYTNLQPLWAEDNLRKNAKITVSLNQTEAK